MPYANKYITEVKEQLELNGEMNSEGYESLKLARRTVLIKSSWC